MESVVFFCSSKYDLDLLGRELKAAFPCTVIGCTTAGEISSGGYQEGGIVGVGISSPKLKLHSRLISPLRGFGGGEARRIAESFQGELAFSKMLDRKKTFGFLMIDGKDRWGR